MPNNDLPVTADAKQNPAPASDQPQSTTPPETDISAQATTGLDLRGYELLERLGGGGMGDVYRAGDPALGRDLAVKVMKADLQGYAAAEQRFLREARVTGSLQHPGIVPVHNLGRLADSRLHYTMRLVRGRTFADILRDEAGQPQRLPALLTIFEKVCQAVAYAHSKQVIHRDLKPSNVMVGRFGEVQVMDWGLAKLLTAEDEPAAAETPADRGGTRIHTEAEDTPLAETRMGREMGTPAYMPPEQALGEWDMVDERADVFALGAILCEILTGRPPYIGSDSAEPLRKAKRGDLAEALARLGNCGADAALVQMCHACLAPARDGRPRDAAQVAQGVAAYQAEVQERLRSAELERATAMVRAGEERKKRRWMGAAVLLLLAGAAVSIWQAVRATKAEGWALTSADAERQANDLAQTRLRQIEKVNEVLTSIFHDLDPTSEEKGGPNLRQQLSQHLELAAARLDEAAVGDELGVARLQTTLGHSLMKLGQTKLAMELLSKAVATLEAKLGSDHLDTILSRNNLAEAYWAAGRTDEAIHLHEQNLKQCEATVGADHSLTLHCRAHLGNAYGQAGRIADAIRLREQNLKQEEAKLGPNHRNTLVTRHNLAAAYLDAGRTADAIPLLEQTLKQEEAKLGTDHPDTLNGRKSLAFAYLLAGRTADAIRIYEQTVKQMEAKLGPDHPSTLGSRGGLALAYRSAGRTTDAIRLNERTLQQMEAKLGPDHPHTLATRGNLANAYLSSGRTTDAIRLHQQTLKQREAKLGPDHPHTLLSLATLGTAYRDTGQLKDAISLLETALERGRKRSDGFPALIARVPGDLAQTYDRAGQFAKAESLYREVLEQTQRQYGAEDSRTADLLSLLSLNLLKQKNYCDAEPLLRRCLTIRVQKQPDLWNTFNTRSMLGEALSGQKKYAEAEPLLMQGYEGMKQRQGKIPPAFRQLRLSEALERLVRLYETTGQKEKAVQCRKKWDEVKAAQKQSQP